MTFTTQPLGASTTDVSPLLSGLSVVLPCFNEEENVADAVRHASAAASEASAAYEIIVVDDGSTDATARVVVGLAATDPHVRLLMHARNRGYGAALRSGIAAAGMDWVLVMDADLQFDLSELGLFVRASESADFIAGWRIDRRDPRPRRVAAAAWNTLLRLTFDIPVRDVDCAFKLIRRRLLAGVDLESTGAMISAELLLRCRAGGARIAEVGVHHRPRVAGRQSGATPPVVARAFRELAHLRGPLRRLTAQAGTQARTVAV